MADGLFVLFLRNTWAKILSRAFVSIGAQATTFLPAFICNALSSPFSRDSANDLCWLTTLAWLDCGCSTGDRWVVKSVKSTSQPSAMPCSAWMAFEPSSFHFGSFEGRS